MNDNYIVCYYCNKKIKTQTQFKYFHDECCKCYNCNEIGTITNMKQYACYLFHTYSCNKCSGCKQEFHSDHVLECCNGWWHEPECHSEFSCFQCKEKHTGEPWSMQYFIINGKYELFHIKCYKNNG